MGLGVLSRVIAVGVPLLLALPTGFASVLRALNPGAHRARLEGAGKSGGGKLEIARASVLALVREPHGRVCPSVYLTRYLAQALGVRTTALRVNH